MRKVIGLVTLVGALAVAPEAGAVPVLLSNTSGAEAAVCAAFDCLSPFATLTDTYSFAPLPNPDGTLTSVVLSGSTVATAGLYLYMYQLANDADSTEVLHGMSIDFRGLTPIGPVTSVYCNAADPCEAPPPVWGADPGTDAPEAAVYETDTDSITWRFGAEGPPPIAGVAKGVTTYWFGAISNLAPTIAEAVVLNTTQISQPNALIPVPEPGSMALLGSGVLALVGAARRRRQQKQAGL